jgi:multicomponent Na+:H+ antiporter subunit B
MPIPIEAILFCFLIVIAVVIAQLEDLFAAAMLTGIFSLLSAGLFTVMDAVDVAFTEAAVGAGVSTVFILGTLSLTTKWEDQQPFRIWPFAAVGIMGAALIYGTLDMPAYGEIHSAPNQHLARQFIEIETKAFLDSHGGGHAEVEHGSAPEEAHASPGDGHGAAHSSSDAEGASEHGQKAVGLPNIVTSILASYRGYDTFGETAVVFTATVGVLLLLRTRRREEDAEDEEEAQERAPSPQAEASP